MTAAIKFTLPSLDWRGHANPFDSGNVGLTFMFGPMLKGSFATTVTPAEAREIAASLSAAADLAEAAQAEGRARVEEAMTGRGQ